MKKKLTFQSQSEVYERVVRDQNGRLFCVRFVVVEHDGILRGRIISVAPITALHEGFKIYDLRFKKRTTYLPVGHALQGVKDKGLKIKDSYASPYFNKFDFLTVIKIRAPSRTRMCAD